MKILVESGATKSTCIGYNDTCIFFTCKTTGINATYASKEAIISIFEEIITKNDIIIEEITNLRYFGAGCFNTKNAEKVKEALSRLFPNANISVFSDLYAACYALCKNSKGFVGILGTGAASCYYNGTQIVDKSPSLGYLLGDEGSGVYLGKKFVQAYLTDKIELEVAKDFEMSWLGKIADEEISEKKIIDLKQVVLEKVYRDPKPQVFFASIPVFMQKHRENMHIKALIANSFQEFFDKQIDYYGNFISPWFFCGSISYYFQDILLEVAGKNEIYVERVIQECALYLLQN